MKKLIFFFLLLPLFGLPVELLKIESVLYPKLLYFDKNLSQKISDHTILFQIIYDDRYEEDAKRLAILLTRQEVDGKKIEVELSRQPSDKPPTAYILALSPSHMEQMIPKLQGDRLIFTVDPDAIRYAHISIYVGARIAPYINPWLIKKSHIELDTTLLKIARFYEK